ncbi:MAG: CocE/NonD family hydrolase [Alphaproteobacteria bacterium]
MQPPHDVAPVETAAMTTRDGVRLDADVWRPAGKGPFPVLLMRQPYGRRIASTPVYAHPSWYARHGFIVVIQDVRGRGTSAGEYRLFVNDAADGADTVRWAAALPGSNGAVGMYGFSYQGNTQLLAAAGLVADGGGAKPLRALAPAMIGWTIRDDWAWEGGAFNLAGGVGWGLQMAAEDARLAGDEEAWLALRAAAASPPLGGPVTASPAVLARWPQYGHYADWVANPDPAPYWDAIAPAGRMAGVDLPMLHVGGWYDTHLAGTLGAFRHFAAAARAPQHLVIGPWTHLGWTGRHPGWDAGPAGESPIDTLQVEWFRYFLAGEGEAPTRLPPVRLFDMGIRAWRGFPTWNDVPARSFYLGGDGRAALLPSSGRLGDLPADAAGEERVVLDPWRPVPAKGGHGAVPMGRVDRADIDHRPDVLTFTTPPLEEEMVLAGSVAAEIFCTADRASFDVSAVLSEVMPDGRALNLTQGYRRVAPGDAVQPVRVEMRATCASIRPGHALRLSLAASDFPAHPVNGGDGAPPSLARAIDAQILTLTVRHGAAAPSRLLLPVLAA